MIRFVRNGFNYDREAASDESGLRCEDVSRTKQEFAEEVDINTIIRRFGISGQMPQGVRMPSYEDFSNVGDFQSAMNAVAESRESFMMMPAEVRARFANDPQSFLEFCANVDNREEAIKLGLVPKPAPAPPPVMPIEVRVVADKPS